MTAKRLVVVGSLIALSVVLGSTPAAGPQPPTPTFYPIDFPGASSTFVFEINEPGDIVGGYGDPTRPVGTRTRGFLLSQGNFSSIDFPGARNTFAIGINACGQIVGRYADQLRRQHGFLLSDGSFMTIDFPGALFTSANTIGPNGDIVGTYVPDDGLNNSKGFLLSWGSFTTIEFPKRGPRTPAALAQRAWAGSPAGTGRAVRSIHMQAMATMASC